MSEAEENPIKEEEDQSGRRVLTWIVGGLCIVLLYFVSFGPVVFVTMKFENEIPDSVNHVLEAIYFPHSGLMYRSEGYFNYVLWWAKTAEPSITSFTHKQFRDDFERRK